MGKCFPVRFHVVSVLTGCSDRRDHKGSSSEISYEDEPINPVLDESQTSKNANVDVIPSQDRIHSSDKI